MSADEFKLEFDSSMDEKKSKLMKLKSQGKRTKNYDNNIGTDCDKLKTIEAPTTSANIRSHFRIDWRQLTYFQKDNRSILTELIRGKKKLKHHEAAHFCNESITGSEDGNKSHSGGHEASELLSNRKRILNSLDGCFKSGELSAILGPSGAGKSTFLSALFGDKQEASYGQTRVTWCSDHGPNAQLHSLEKRRTIRIAFLPQHDHLLNHLTVYETLMFASKIKNPFHSSGPNDSFHRSNVRRVAKMLKLTDCFNTRCGRLSGGQYKRVSIGQELLSEPDVIILDEPTSGLDAMTCLTTIRTLKSIVMKHPISIILTIHQPDIDVFNLFDHVYVIAQGGLAIFEGPPQEVVSTLAKVNLFMPSHAYNPARFIVENAFVADLESGGGNANSYLKSAESERQVDCDLNDASLELSSDTDEAADENEPPNLVRRSISSLTEAFKGTKRVDLKPAPGLDRKFRESGKRPLLNIGIQTADGKLITSDDLLMMNKQDQTVSELKSKALIERMNLLKRLNQLQKARYYNTVDDLSQRESNDGDNYEFEKHPNRLHNSESAASISSASSSFYSEAHETLPEKRSTLQPRQPGAEQSIDRTHLALETFDSFGTGANFKLRRKFDKRLSAKHNQSKQSNYPIWYHSYLLTHRTWLSIVRDPIFFGIQFTMHTTIPILLALIFGSQQEEGCPQVGHFDLVQFAYQPTDQTDFIESTMRSVRHSIGNIGIIFFEMFVLSFAINCITALVFPLDMYVLLKEYRNSWYSLSSYFIGRTLADLPVPVVLHSIAMAILYYLTGQPFIWWRFCAIIGIVILASLVAQSIGLTIGALLMRSSQSAVLAAAGIVAPFFALSGFIVRIHTLPVVAQFFANGSYLYHLLNGFIILRYGFGRCACDEEDFQTAAVHQIPNNLKTMASIWIGTYANEFEQTHESDANALIQQNNSISSSSSSRTNVDPNIDIIGKLMNAFKMANTFGHKVENCDDVLPYAMLDFNLRDSDITLSCLSLLLMLVVTRFITFGAIYYKIRSFS